MEDDVDGSLIRALGGLRSPAAAGLQPLFGGDSPNGKSLSPKGGLKPLFGGSTSPRAQSLSSEKPFSPTGRSPRNNRSPRSSTDSTNHRSPRNNRSPGSSTEKQAQSSGLFSEGQKIEARHGGKKRFYPGAISKVLGNGKFNILYDDGEMEDDVDGSLIRATAGGEEPASGDGGRASSGGSAFTKGQKIEARYGGKKRFYPGAISYVLGKEKYNILYDDGEMEDNVDGALIRMSLLT
jgi:hypothetical protein